MIIKNVQVYDDLSLYVIHVIMIDVYMKKWMEYQYVYYYLG